MPALPPAVFAYVDDVAREDGLVTASVDSDILIMDALVVSVTVKLPGVNALAAPTQRYDSEGLRQGEGSREKLRSKAAVVSVTVNGKLYQLFMFSVAHRFRRQRERTDI